MKKFLVVVLTILLAGLFNNIALAMNPTVMLDADKWDSGEYSKWKSSDIADLKASMQWEIFQGYPSGKTAGWDYSGAPRWLGWDFSKGPEPNRVYYVTGNEPQFETQPTFLPEKTITRAEFATILSRVLDLDQQKASGQIFTDVKPDAWYYNNVTVLAEKDIIPAANYVGKVFRPDEGITRFEMATWVARAADHEGLKAPDGDIAFMDYAKESPGYENIRKAVKLGILQGYPEDGTFRPEGTAKRIEAALMIMRLVRQLPGQEDPKNLVNLYDGFLKALSKLQQETDTPDPDIYQYGLDKYLTTPNLKRMTISTALYDRPDIKAPGGVGGFAPLIGNGITLWDGLITSRTDTPMMYIHYNAWEILDWRPVFIGRNVAAVDIVSQSTVYFWNPINKPLLDKKRIRVVYFKKENGQWKISGQDKARVWNGW